MLTQVHKEKVVSVKDFIRFDFKSCT